MTAAKILEIKVQASKLQETLGLLAETQEQLNAVSSALEKATEETKESGSMLSKAYNAVCKKMKEFALTIKKGVLGGLKDSLKVARNLVMALGAAAASAIAISSGSIQRDRESKDSKVSASQLLAWNYAKEQTGISDNELNLATLQSHIGDLSSAGHFGALGLTQSELEGLDGVSAMQKVIAKAIEKGGEKMDTGAYNAYKEALSALLGIDSKNRLHILGDKTQKEFNKEYRWGLANGIDNDTLMKGEKAWNKFKFTLNKVGTELAAIALPAVIKGLDKLSIFVHDIVKWIKGDAGKNASKILEKLVTGIIDLSQKALPYFISGLSVLASVLEVLNNNMDKGFLGKLMKGANWVLNQTVGRVAEGTAQIMSMFNYDGVDFNAREFHHQDGKYISPYESGKAQINRTTAEGSPERAMAHLLNDYTHGKISQSEFQKQFKMQVVVNNHANSDGTIATKVASKMGGR